MNTTDRKRLEQFLADGTPVGLDSRYIVGGREVVVDLPSADSWGILRTVDGKVIACAPSRAAIAAVARLLIDN